MMRFNRRLLKLYKNSPLRYKLYTFIRCLICPFYEIAGHVPKEGKIMDFGCGHGIFANIMAIDSNKRFIIGIDLMRDKIKIANSTLYGRDNIEFRVADAFAELKEKDFSCVTLIDVLHYIPLEKKRDILKRLYGCLPKEGVLIVKSISESPPFKYFLTLFHVATIDKIMHGCFENNSYFLKTREYLDLLRSIGFYVEFKDISKGFPYSHCLYICKKTDSIENKSYEEL